MKFLSTLLNEYLSLSTSEYIFDKDGYGSDPASALKIPISGPMFQRVWPKTIRSTVFHATDLKGLQNLKKIEGKKKTISAFWAMMSRYMESGVATEGGLVVEMEGDVLISSRSDIMSQVDRQGRRWVEMSWFRNASHWGNGPEFKKVKKDFRDLIVKLVKKHLISKQITEGWLEDMQAKDRAYEKAARAERLKREKNPQKLVVRNVEDAFEHWSNMKRHLKGDGKKLRLVIKDYFDGVEKIFKRNKKILEKLFYGYANSKRSTDDSWDEQLVNNIKIKKIHVLKVKSYEDEDYVVHDDVTSVGNWPIEYWDASINLEIYTRQVVKKEIGK